MKPGRILMALAMAGCLVTLAACSSRLVRVQPYEREYLAQDKMYFTPSPAKAGFDEHVFSIREASRGGEASFQGGCGCR